MNAGKPTPRNTPFWREQSRLFLEAIEEAFNRPIVRTGWLSLAEIRAERAGVALEYRRREDRISVAAIRTLCDEPETILSLVCELIAAEVPQLAWACGPLLPRTVLGIADAMIGRPGAEPSHVWRFLPENPLVLDAQGCVSNGPDAAPKHWAQIGEYFSSLRPAPARGRPSGTGHLSAMTVDQFRKAYRDLVAEFTERGDGRPTRHDLAAVLNVSTKTVDRFVDDNRLRWPPV